MEYMAKVNITKRYEVEFAKDGKFHKKGDKVEANMCLISKWYKEGLVEVIPQRLKDDAEKLGCEGLFSKDKKRTA